MLLNPQGQRPPQLPPELLKAAVEGLSLNPQTRPIAEAIMKVMGVGQGQGTPPPTAPPTGTPPMPPQGQPPQGMPPQGGAMPPGMPLM